MPNKTDKKSDGIPSCHSWLTDTEHEGYRENLKKAIKKAGIPLELKTKYIFEELGYNWREIYYRSALKDITKQLDFNSDKYLYAPEDFDEPTAKIDENFVINLSFIGDCTYRSKTDIFVFDIGMKNVVFPLIRPLIHSLFFPSSALGLGYNILFDNEITKKVFTTSKAVGVNFKEFNMRTKDKEKNFENSMIFNKGENIIEALDYEFTRYGMDLWDLGEFFLGLINYIDLRGDKYHELKIDISNLISWYADSTALNPNRSNRRQLLHELEVKLINELKKINKKDLAELYPLMIFDIIIPMVVIDEDRGIVKVNFENTEIKDFEEIPFFIYQHNSSIHGSLRYDWLRKGGTIPIVVCNAKNLKDCIKFLENECEKIASEIRKSMTEDPLRYMSCLFDMNGDRQISLA